eukprot:5443341-Prymnesium_polylepis.1
MLAFELSDDSLTLDDESQDALSPIGKRPSRSNYQQARRAPPPSRSGTLQPRVIRSPMDSGSVSSFEMDESLDQASSDFEREMEILTAPKPSWTRAGGGKKRSPGK